MIGAKIFHIQDVSQSMTDAQLVVLIKKDNQRAYKELFERYSKKLYYFSIKKNLSNEDAEGVVQDVFAKIWELRKNLDDNLSINAYIITIAKNLIYNKSRKQLNQYLFEEYLSYTRQKRSNNTENHVFYKDLEYTFYEIVNELAPRTQTIFKMNRLEGLSNQEISEELSISKKTVENQMHTALKYIKVQLALRTDLTFIITLLHFSFIALFP